MDKDRDRRTGVHAARSDQDHRAWLEGGDPGRGPNGGVHHPDSNRFRDHVDLSAQVDAYHRKRDAVVAELSDLYELAPPDGAFYAFPRAPWGTGSEFVADGGILSGPGY